MSDEKRTILSTFTAPYGRKLRLEEVCFDSGMRLLRITIREGLRITVLDIDADTAKHWANTMVQWAEQMAEE